MSEANGHVSGFEVENVCGNKVEKPCVRLWDTCVGCKIENECGCKIENECGCALTIPIPVSARQPSERECTAAALGLTRAVRTPLSLSARRV